MGRRNLPLAVVGSVHLRNHVVLRDALRANPNLAREYGALKRELAARYPEDIESYVAGKTAFVTVVLEASGAFTPVELAEIRTL